MWRVNKHGDPLLLLRFLISPCPVTTAYQVYLVVNLLFLEKNLRIRSHLSHLFILTASYALGKDLFVFFFSGEWAAYERIEAQLMGTSLRICCIVHTENIIPVKVCI